MTTDTALVGELVSTMIGLAKQVRRAFAEAPSPVPGVETTQLALLVKIGHEPLGVSRLAELVHSDSSTVSRHVNRLAEHGLVTKTTAPHDRRMQVLGLTDEGEAARRRLLAERAELFAQFLSDVDDAEVATLHALLTRVSAGVDAHLAERSRA